MEKFNTPIVKIKSDENYNDIYIKRDDLIPFSFGGNKVRIANEFLEDMKSKNYTSIISYGSSKSNLNRAVSNLARANNINCYIVSPLDGQEKEESYNKELCLFSISKDNIFNSEVINVRKTIEKVIEISKNKGESPYYINGKSDGTGNELIPVKAYEKCYEEILKYE
ncbi:MAG: pyridoxal-phosphate dependent enzyme, partial [Fusobacterium sp. JB021]|nr:pyridoxal-phosphate dependent enzyme [Fusobacterium sp. JB021]